MEQYIQDMIEQKKQMRPTAENMREVGCVVSVQGYILEVNGLDHVMFNERVIIGRHSEGYVNNIRRSSVMVAVTSQVGDIYVDDEVEATGEIFKAAYSEQSIGHIVDIFGRDRLVGQVFENLEYLPTENPTTPIMDRTAVNRPLETGIAGIDLIYPIGKGQRQLIVGDKKTGKSQLCLDAIVNQKGKDVMCIYITIGKTKKNVKEVYAELARRGAMEYTLILAAVNDDLPPVIHLTPYVGLTIAEKYMMQGKDVLVVIDDLKRHADNYREISLLVGKVPGRDAYPPDIFYTHSRMLEKGCQHKCGGSITILPIVETKGGDITGYITTNIISITDGQIVLSKKAFDQNQKPAINYGLSVSRLGGAVQTPAVKKLGARVRRELLSYLETREVYQLSNMDEMGPELQARIKRGEQVLAGLCQYKYSPMSEETILEKFRPLYENR
ncbi:MAG: F0F1 ATP synthase subunit alpha [Lachnospiraceae bacterium]|nr:F0F1 ATP synthase subunit alpha [Lachnospiraceae bacterium]